MKYLADLYTELVTVWFKFWFNSCLGCFAVIYILPQNLQPYPKISSPREEKRNPTWCFWHTFQKEWNIIWKKASGIIFTKNHLGPTARPHPSLSWSDVTAKARVISLSLPSGCLVLYPSPLWLSVGFAFRADHPSQTWCQKQVLGQLNNAYTIMKLLYNYS